MINQGHRHDIINAAKRKKSSTISFRIDSNYEHKLRHELGKKGSLFLKTYIETVIKAALGRECKPIVTEESIVVEFQE